ncbi:hypothetical protein niasHS_017361 [Heterodera schachtii]|uniref:C2H2-type domain-containing protein n=1 Tax=Heterodera schachtii TaxID=97005 RepID=A0ABD2HTU5_HETSC
MATENLKMPRKNEKKLEICKICGYRGKWRSEIIRHQKVHQKKRPYKCKLCYWSSKWKNGIVRHIINMHKISADQAENAIHQEELILIE